MSGRQVLGALAIGLILDLGILLVLHLIGWPAAIGRL